MRHIVAWIKQQLVEERVGTVDWVWSEEQLADVLTKSGVNTRAFPELWWTFKTFISKLHNLFRSQSIFNLKAQMGTTVSAIRC